MEEFSPDDTDLRLLSLLQDNARLPNVQLAAEVGLSESPTFRRVKQLEASGAIRGYVALLEQRALGLQVTAFVSVRMARQPEDEHSAFHAAVRSEPHIVECHAMSGAFDFLMKVVAHDIDHFAELCMQQILKYPGVAQVESAFSLAQVKQSHAVPLTTAGR